MRNCSSLELGPIHFPIAIFPLFSEDIPCFVSRYARRKPANDDLLSCNGGFGLSHLGSLCLGIIVVGSAVGVRFASI